MRIPVIAFLAVSALFYQFGTPFDGRFVPVRPPFQSERAESVAAPVAPHAPAGLSYQRELTDLRRSYRYALTDAEKKATNSLLTQVISAVKPTSSVRRFASVDDRPVAASARRSGNARWTQPTEAVRLASAAAAVKSIDDRADAATAGVILPPLTAADLSGLAGREGEPASRLQGDATTEAALAKGSAARRGGTARSVSAGRRGGAARAAEARKSAVKTARTADRNLRTIGKMPEPKSSKVAAARPKNIKLSNFQTGGGKPQRKFGFSFNASSGFSLN